MDAVLHGPGEGEHYDAGPAQIFVKATGEHTGGSFFLAESTLAPGFAGPPPHRHRELHDMFYVLEGTLTLRLGDGEIEAGPGTFACIPPGVVHTFGNDSANPVRLLNFNTPAGWETSSSCDSGVALPAWRRSEQQQARRVNAARRAKEHSGGRRTGALLDGSQDRVGGLGRVDALVVGEYGDSDAAGWHVPEVCLEAGNATDGPPELAAEVADESPPDPEAVADVGVQSR
jgi:quercetin dioxygenase-like cupin family protein